ncbi:hypothetical protein LshimejAT787_0308830 [Lyophyllum shimeji]|uniref:DUF7704 domain-containing protein n=1 Tax=Lyophyllum shimeji TaxID=47721 RepID=A0A9P3UMC0_LYOSH|nr:hypothetical protein LshimejAT787_0308830 [Lyophyllum shimeji]
MPKPFPALPGFYYPWFMYFEPLSTFAPALTCLISPGTAWYFHELLPSDTPPPTNMAGLEPRAVAAIWQLANSYMLLGLLQTFGFRAIRDTLPNNPAAQERILGASLTALALADVTHILVTFFALPPDIRYDLSKWNTMAHGNTTVVLALLITRLAWFAGIGRTRYYFGQTQQGGKKRA